LRPMNVRNSPIPTGPKQSNYAIFILRESRPKPPGNTETGG
jgi:hypothetical protein